MKKVDGQLTIQMIDIGKIKKQSKWGEIYDLSSRNNGELAWLEMSIRKYGILEPIIIWKNPNNKYIIIDGRKRHKICQKLGYDKIPVILLFGKNLAEVKELALQKNLARLHMSVGQKAAVGLALIDGLPVGRGRRTDLPKNATIKKRQEELKAELEKLKAPMSNIYKLKKIIRLGCHDLVQKIIQGKITLHYAYKKAKRKENKSNQKGKAKLKGRKNDKMLKGQRGKKGQDSDDATANPISKINWNNWRGVITDGPDIRDKLSAIYQAAEQLLLSADDGKVEVVRATECVTFLAECRDVYQGFADFLMGDFLPDIEDVMLKLKAVEF